VRREVAAACLVLLSGCGTYSGTREPPRPPDVRPAPDARPPPSAPPVRSGGYYLDDGPGDNPPPNLLAVPDAVPRVEPLHRGALRPYTVMGRNYAPMTAVEPYRARGVASWYGRRYHGKQTSTGEIYDMYGMSAAHPTLPLPSYVRVTSVANGKSVIVRVNDRGPFIDSRLIDLSYTAAYKLGVIAGGSALVDVEAIVPGTSAPVVAATNPVPPSAPVAPPPAAAAERQIPLAADGAGVHLQLAAFGSKENAEAYASRLRGDFAWLSGQLQVFVRDGLFRVLAGPYVSAAEARQNADRISQEMGVKPFVLVR
jgi:rare lipoprotein A